MLEYTDACKITSEHFVSLRVCVLTYVNNNLSYRGPTGQANSIQNSRRSPNALNHIN